MVVCLEGCCSSHRSDSSGFGCDIKLSTVSYKDAERRVLCCYLCLFGLDTNATLLGYWCHCCKSLSVWRWWRVRLKINWALALRARNLSSCQLAIINTIANLTSVRDGNLVLRASEKYPKCGLGWVRLMVHCCLLYLHRKKMKSKFGEMSCWS